MVQPAAKFHTLPNVISAQAYDGTKDSAKAIMEWIWSVSPGTVCTYTEDGLRITTLEGVMKVSPGDWVIQGTHNEFYPCKPDVFSKKYAPELDPLTRLTRLNENHLAFTASKDLTNVDHVNEATVLLAASEFMATLKRVVPGCAEQTLALRQVELAVFWAGQGIIHKGERYL